MTFPTDENPEWAAEEAALTPDLGDEAAGVMDPELEEDLGPYSDAQIGSAVRAIHGGRRSVLKDRVDLAPILPGAEGATVTVEPGFDPAAVRVTAGPLAPEPAAVGHWRPATR